MAKQDYTPRYHTESAVKLMRAVGKYDEETICKFSPIEIDMKLNIMLDKVNYRQGKALELRYGFWDGITHDLETTGKKLGVSRERARQLEAKGIKKMQEIKLEELITE